MKEERVYHVDKDKEMLKDKKQYKEDYTKFDGQNQSEIENLNKELDQNLKDLEKSLNTERLQLIETYERKLNELKDELELRMKVEIHEIEERKN
jgi:chromosome segregation ATPase